jgi:virulence-associated protein VagC
MKGRRRRSFGNGGCQAVRLPRECCFPKGETEVLVRRVGRKVILEPVDEWSKEFLACLGLLSEGIPRPNSPPITTLRDPFG